MYDMCNCKMGSDVKEESFNWVSEKRARATTPKADELERMRQELKTTGAEIDYARDQE
jgi:hypothetical protein